LAALPGLGQTLYSGGWESLAITNYDRYLLGTYGLLLGTVFIGRLQADRMHQRLTEDGIVYDKRTPKVYWSLSAKQLSTKASICNRLCEVAFLSNQFVTIRALTLPKGLVTTGPDDLHQVTRSFSRAFSRTFRTTFRASSRTAS
jgi:hypothetical protein